MFFLLIRFFKKSINVSGRQGLIFFERPFGIITAGRVKNLSRFYVFGLGGRVADFRERSYPTVRCRCADNRHVFVDRAVNFDRLFHGRTPLFDGQYFGRRVLGDDRCGQLARDFGAADIRCLAFGDGSRRGVGIIRIDDGRFTWDA